MSRCVNFLFFGTHNFVVENIVNISLTSIVTLPELRICVVWRGGSPGKRMICYRISSERWNKYKKPVLMLLTSSEK